MVFYVLQQLRFLSVFRWLSQKRKKFGKHLDWNGFIYYNVMTYGNFYGRKDFPYGKGI